MHRLKTRKRGDGSDGHLKNSIAAGGLATDRVVTGFAILRIGGSSLALN